MANKPSTPKGTRDFNASQLARRNYIFNSIKNVFELYGFSPIETPTIENLTSLMGKYGEEGDKLLFKILNSGDYSKNLSLNEITNPINIADKGLRYDLTVPFARYVVQHRAEIQFPFKRYQIAPVWRADRPQKGRYREFYQCDVDTIGTKSLLCEVELLEIVQRVFQKLKINVVLKINNRKILAAIASTINHPDKLVEIATAIDKIDKIGENGVIAELQNKGIDDSAIEHLIPILNLQGTNSEKLDKIQSIVGSCEGIDEVEYILQAADKINMSLPIELDLSLARGLSYYTGAIFEVKATDFAMGSICGGGRYDDLTGIFGLPDTSGVGISFGADRIYDVMIEGDLFPKDIEVSTKVLFANFSDQDAIAALPILTQLRDRAIPCQLYPTPAKMKKQFDYATNNNIPYIAFVGEEERNSGTVTLKELETGEQQILTINNFLAKFSM